MPYQRAVPHRPKMTEADMVPSPCDQPQAGMPRRVWWIKFESLNLATFKCPLSWPHSQNHMHLLEYATIGTRGCNIPMVNGFINRDLIQTVTGQRAFDQ